MWVVRDENRITPRTMEKMTFDWNYQTNRQVQFELIKNGKMVKSCIFRKRHSYMQVFSWCFQFLGSIRYFETRNTEIWSDMICCFFRHFNINNVCNILHEHNPGAFGNESNNWTNTYEWKWMYASCGVHRTQNEKHKFLWISKLRFFMCGKILNWYLCAFVGRFAKCTISKCSKQFSNRNSPTISKEKWFK